MKSGTLALVLLLMLDGGDLWGQSKSASASYELLHAPAGGGGGQVNNGSNMISAQITVGQDLAGAVSDITPGLAQEKPGYIGQLYDLVSLVLSASPNTIDEGSSRQLEATGILDDLTTLALPGLDVRWSVVLGPLTGIDAAGLATAGGVFERTSAIARGSFQGVEDQIDLTILDVDPDNFDSYAGDALDDAWQVSFFGLPPNANAAPGANPDNDLYDNRFEFLTGYDPTDSSDFFTFSVVDLTGTTATLELSKIIPGTRYHFERSADLNQTDLWIEFANFTTSAEVTKHQVTDPNATGSRGFYRVGVEPE